MLTLIVDTGELAELVRLDPATGEDMVLNYFRQSGQLDNFFYFCPRQQRYLCSEETFTWCKELLEEFDRAN